MPTSQQQRKILGQYNNQVFTILARYAHYAEANCEFAYDTILLRDVRDINQFPLCDHLWVKAPKYVPHGIKPGHDVKVEGRVNQYRRIDGSEDYTLYVFNIKRGVID